MPAGLAAIGSGIGGGVVAKESCPVLQGSPKQAIRTNIMLLGQAIAQTPAILGLLIAFILIFKKLVQLIQLRLAWLF